MVVTKGIIPKIFAIVTVEAIVGSNPDIAIVGLSNTIDPTAREAIGNGFVLHFDAVLLGLEREGQE